jgi:outer membrane protein assembly factor BamB
MGISTHGNTLALHGNVVTSGRDSYLTIVNLSNGIVARDTKNSLLGGSTVSVLWRNPKMLLVGVDSSVKARDPLTHNEIWKNGLKGTGSSRGVSIIQNDKHILAGANGYALCLDPDNGNAKWKKGLSGSGFGNFVSLLVRNDKLITACNGMAYALDISTGNFDWKLDLKCGSGHVTIVDVNTPIMEFNAQPMLHVIEQIKEEEAATTTI